MDGPPPGPYIDPECQEKAREYARIRRRLFVVDLAIGAVYALALWLTEASQGLKAQAVALTDQPQMVVGLYALVFMALYGLLLFPLSAYSGFRLPHRYGLSTQTFPAWLADWLKGGLLGLAFGVVVIEVIYYLLANMPDYWWLVAAVVMLFFNVVLTNLLPILIVPLFFKLTPLKDDQLARRLLDLTQRAGVRVRGVYTINLSSKTTAANAALMGLGNTRRVVLGDTMLGTYTPDELETVLAHELGHHAHGDIPKGIAVQALDTLASFWIADVVLKATVVPLGFDSIADIAAFPVFALVLGAISVAAMPLGNGFSRWMERKADEYAMALSRKPQAFKSGMVKLANQNLSEVDPERWVEVLLYDHPAVGRRIAHAEEFARRMGESG